MGSYLGPSPNNNAHKYQVTTQQLDEPNIKFTTFLLQFRNFDRNYLDHLFNKSRERKSGSLPCSLSIISYKIGVRGVVLLAAVY